MLAILNSLNAHNFLFFQRILMILVSKFMVHRALSDKAYLSSGLLSRVTYGSAQFIQQDKSQVLIFLLFSHE